MHVHTPHRDDRADQDQNRDQTFSSEKLLLIAALAGTLLHVVLLGIFDNPLDHLFSDPARHWNNAKNFLTPKLMSGLDPIFYQAWLWLVRTLTGGNYVAIGIYNGVLSGLMPWLFYRAARAFGLDKEVSLTFWVLMAWTPSFLAIYRYFMMETVLLALLALALWMTGRCLRKNTTAAFLAMLEQPKYLTCMSLRLH